MKYLEGVPSPLLPLCSLSVPSLLFGEWPAGMRGSDSCFADLVLYCHEKRCALEEEAAILVEFARGLAAGVASGKFTGSSAEVCFLQRHVGGVYAHV